jgi:4-hydroxybenzoate polyprenyltransferase
VGWVLLAFTAARFAGMGFNRIVDRDVDARNPRTAMREIPRGALTVGRPPRQWSVMSALFVFASWRLNPLCFALSPVALLWVLGYSYTKRFTRWSHLWLGLGLGIAPVGGYLAVTGAWSTPWWMLCLLSLAVMTWTGGFDILYALQDAEFDQQQRPAQPAVVDSACRARSGGAHAARGHGVQSRGRGGVRSAGARRADRHRSRRRCCGRAC